MNKNFFNFLRIRRVKIERFIKELSYSIKLRIKGFIFSKGFKTKTKELMQYLFNVCITGIIIYYTLTHFNWFSVGLISALTTYYIEWFVNLIKEKKE